MLPRVNPSETIAWQKLTSHFLEMQATHMRELFTEDPDRFRKFHLSFETLLVDYSKNIITEETLRLLIIGKRMSTAGSHRGPIQR
jgi:glucose-6-phosphate isomerase